MKVIQPVLTEQVVMFIQVALDTHLKAHGVNGVEVFTGVAQALNVPWVELPGEPVEPAPEPVDPPAEPKGKAKA